jgi:periplasmic divalent cation tolerance protein
MTAILFVYVTCSNLAEAERIGRALVEERLAACVNLLPGMRSLYRWQERVDQADEVVLLAKTAGGRFEALAARVRALHSYTLPCIVALPVVAGVPDYLAWVAAGSQPEAVGPVGGGAAAHTGT